MLYTTDVGESMSREGGTIFYMNKQNR